MIRNWLIGILAIVYLPLQAQNVDILLKEQNSKSFWVKSGTVKKFSSGDGHAVVPVKHGSGNILHISYLDNPSEEWLVTLHVQTAQLLILNHSVNELTLQNLSHTLVAKGEKMVHQQPYVIQPGVDAFAGLLGNVVSDNDISNRKMVEVLQTKPFIAASTTETQEAETISVSADIAEKAPERAGAIAPVTTANAAVAKTSVQQVGITPAQEVAETELDELVGALGSITNTHTEVSSDHHTTKSPGIKEPSAALQEDKGTKIATNKGGNEAQPAETTVSPAEEAVSSSNSPVLQPHVVNDLANALTGIGTEKDDKKEESKHATQTEAVVPRVIAPQAQTPTPVKKEAPASADDVQDLASALMSANTIVPVKTTQKEKHFSTIKRTLERRGNEGIELIYIDQLPNGKSDTIRLLIPTVR